MNSDAASLDRGTSESIINCAEILSRNQGLGKRNL